MLLSYHCNHLYLFNVKNETPLSLKILTISLRASPPGHSGRGGWGVGGGGKEGELATMSLELNMCFEKVSAKC